MLPALSGIVGRRSHGHSDRDRSERDRTRSGQGGDVAMSRHDSAGSASSSTSAAGRQRTAYPQPQMPSHMPQPGYPQGPAFPQPQVPPAQATGMPPPPDGGKALQGQYDVTRDRDPQSQHEGMRERQRQAGGHGSGVRHSSNHMESSVTRLLVATKMLLEALTKWSLGQRTETQVSDIYVRLGNDFNTAKVAFSGYGIDMSDLVSVPDDLRTCLERCLSEDASPAVLEVHLPRIREIIINLLQGLKLKQAEYKQYLLQQRASSSGSRESLSGASGHRSSRLGASSRTERLAASDGGAPSGTELTDSEATQPNAPNRASSAAAIRRTGSGRSTASVASQSGGVRRAESGHSQPTSVEVEATTEQSLSASERGGPGRAPLPQPPARENGSESERAVEVPQKRSIGRRGTGSNGTSALGRSPLGEGSPLSLAAETDASSNERPSAPAQRLPDAVQRHSLVDGPVPRSEGGEEVVQEVTTPPTNGDESQETVSGPPEVSISSPSGRVRGSGRGAPDAVEADPSLRALKSRDALERRASKRFSAYTFNKMGVGQSFGQGFGSGSLGMGMGMLALNNGSGTPTVERRGTAGGAPAPEKRSSGSRRAAKATSERPTSDDSRSGVSQGRGDYFSSGSRGKGRALPSSSSGAIEEEARTPSTNAGTPGAQEEEPSNRRSGSTRPARSPRAEVATLARPALNTHHTASSTESLPFVDAPSGAPPIQLSEDESEQFVPPVPPLPTPAERARLDAMQERGSNVRSPGPSPSSLSTPLPTVTSSNTVVGSSGAVQMALFLQLGRQTRKAVLDLDPTAPGRGVSVGRLRMLFIDRFAYSPGMDDFPAIYLKDPGTGVAFELEDLGDVQEGCLLTLNIEPLDQVKQHLDLSLGAITREIRELKTAFADREREASRRISHSYAGDALAVAVAAAAAQPTPTPKISDSQFQAAGQRVAQLKRANTRAAAAAAAAAAGESVGEEGRSPTMSTVSTNSSSAGVGPSSSAAAGARVAEELKAQYDELQNLRREFAILQQIQGDFTTDVKGFLGNVREQAGRVRTLATAEVPAERAFIVAGKARLDGGSQEVLTLVEDLQDTVDDLKLDVIQRGVKPKPGQLKSINADIERATKGLEEVEKYVQTVKPSWKKTWEAELQNIVDEQEFLNHQEGLISDLRDDHAALQEVFANIQQVVKLRGTTGPGARGVVGSAGRNFVVPPPDEGHEGLNTVMMEVKGLQVDSSARLRALAQAEKQRERELAARTDELQQELVAGGKGLKKTGGYSEAERQRERRNEATLKAMFAGVG